MTPATTPKVPKLTKYRLLGENDYSVQAVLGSTMSKAQAAEVIRIVEVAHPEALARIAEMEKAGNEMSRAVERLLTGEIDEDDIHWSKESRKAWEAALQTAKVPQ